MDFKKMLSGVSQNEPSPRGLIGLTFAEYIAGNATFEEWLLAGAKDISDTARKYNPVYIAPLTDRLRSYVDGRLEARIDYFDQSALALGEWAVDIRRRIDSNQTDVKTLQWARQKCVENEILKGGIPNIDYALLKFENQPKPYQDLVKAHKVLELDARSRIKNMRGNAK